MTSRLAYLRSQLAVLRRARRRVRALAAWTALASAVLLALAAVFVLDLVFGLAVPQRVVALVLAGLAVGWALWRYTWPLLGVRENEIDAALLVERQQRIDSDLVAALQFEQAAARNWGSPELSSTVIEQVAADSPRINVFAGFSREPLLRRLSLLIACLAVVLVVGVLWPGHLAVFANRLLLGSRHYPTRTHIEQVVVNRLPVLLPNQRNAALIDAKAAQGRPVTFLVQCAGELPGEGWVHVAAGDSNRQRTRIVLAPLALNERLARLKEAQLQIDEAVRSVAGPISPPWQDEVLTLLRFDAPAAAQLLAAAKTHADLPPISRGVAAAITELPANHANTALLAGELGRLDEDVTYRLSAGDARTDAATLTMIPLPAIEVLLNPTPPKYAGLRREKTDTSNRQIALLEGSSVELAALCTNGKPLESVWLTLQSAQGTTRFELAPDDARRAAWRLADKNSPLARVTEELRYEVQVLDGDGLSLESPIRGTIRIRPDLPPTSLAEVVHRVVLPTAAPVIAYRASDDYGLSRLVLVAEIERQAPRLPAAGDAGANAADETNSQTPMPAAAVPAETHRLDILTAKEPLAGERLPLVGQYALALEPLRLVKGDRVKLTLEATDYRGENGQGEPAGRAQTGEALILEISDESGVLAAISEADPRSEEQLNAIIKRQLGIGEESQP
jgi:hypothetical protein